MTHKIFNLSNVLGCAAFILVILVPGAVEAEKYKTALFMIACVGILAHLSMKEDGQRE